jgi:hypothetical protein
LHHFIQRYKALADRAYNLFSRGLVGRESAVDEVGGTADFPGEGTDQFFDFLAEWCWRASTEFDASSNVPVLSDLIPKSKVEVHELIPREEVSIGPILKEIHIHEPLVLELKLLASAPNSSGARVLAAEGLVKRGDIFDSPVRIPCCQVECF